MMSPLFLSKRRRTSSHAARQVSWLPGPQRLAARASRLPRCTHGVASGTSCPATVAGPRRNSTGFPLGPCGAPRRHVEQLCWRVYALGRNSSSAHQRGPHARIGAWRRPDLPKDRTPKRKGERRRPIIGAYARELVTHGRAGASIARVADEVGVAPGLIHHHFETSCDLETALLDSEIAS